MKHEIDNVKRDMAKGFETAAVSTAEFVYSEMSEEIKKYEIHNKDISRALSEGYHFVGNGYDGHVDDAIYKYPLSFSECVDFCTKKKHDAGESWNSFDWSGHDNWCMCYKGERGHTPDAKHVHFRI